MSMVHHTADSETKGPDRRRSGRCMGGVVPADYGASCQRDEEATVSAKSMLHVGEDTVDRLRKPITL